MSILRAIPFLLASLIVLTPMLIAQSILGVRASQPYTLLPGGSCLPSWDGSQPLPSMEGLSPDQMRLALTLWQVAHQRLASASPLKASAAHAPVPAAAVRSKKKDKKSRRMTSPDLTFEPFQITDQIADLTGIQPELGHILMAGDNTFTERFFK